MEAKKNPSRDIHRMYPITLLTGLCASVGIVIVAFEMQFRSEPIVTGDPDPWEDPMTLIDPTIITEIKPEPEYRVRTQKKLTVIPTQIDVAAEPQVAEPELELNDPFEPVNEAQPVEQFESGPDEPVAVAEVPPSPEGGFEGFYKFLRRELKYPRRAVSARVEGRVFVEFVVDREGFVSSVRVLRGIGYGCDEEAVRVISKTKWTAGMQGGRPVKVRMIAPIHFALD
jgi:protein TonB